MWDLTKKDNYEALKAKCAEFAEKHNLKLSNENLKAGDKIQFMTGYNDDILACAEIFGFDEENKIYLVWDCFWFGTKNEEKRKIKIINNQFQKELKQEKIMQLHAASGKFGQEKEIINN